MCFAAYLQDFLCEFKQQISLEEKRCVSEEQRKKTFRGCMNCWGRYCRSMRTSGRIFFIPGTTKYTDEELRNMIHDDQNPIYIAADEQDICEGYAFCQLRQQPFSNNMVPFLSLFIDDLCVDQKTRGQHVGESLFEFVKQEAKRLGCYEVQLNVWDGNTSAERLSMTAWTVSLLQAENFARPPISIRRRHPGFLPDI